MIPNVPTILNRRLFVEINKRRRYAGRYFLHILKDLKEVPF